MVPQTAPRHIKLKALFAAGGVDVCISALTEAPIPPPPPPRPPDATLSAFWRPLWHMTGFGLGLPGGHLQDPSAPYQDPATGTSLSGSLSTILTVLSWICAGIYMCGALPSPVCA